MFSSDTISESEKINRTYQMLKHARRVRRISLILRIAILGGLYYGYIYINQPENAETKAMIFKEIRVKLAEFIAPLVQDMIGDVIQNMQGAG